MEMESDGIVVGRRNFCTARGPYETAIPALESSLKKSYGAAKSRVPYCEEPPHLERAPPI